MKIIPVLYNIRSTYNVGSIYRTSDGLGIEQLITIGVTPHFKQPDDKRLPHVVLRAEKQISKTALGAESTIRNKHFNSFEEFLTQANHPIIALEQSSSSVPLEDFAAPEQIYLLLGEETQGVPKDILEKCDHSIEIAMHGKKNSFNVSVAFAIAAYSLSK